MCSKEYGHTALSKKIMKNKNALQIHLGENFEFLNNVVKDAHIGTIELEGNIEVTRGNFIANVLCNILKMPKAGKSVFNTVKAYHYPDRMQWKRTFDGVTFNSCFTLSGGFLVENMGPLKLFLKGSVENGALIYRLAFVKVLDITIPKLFSPNLYASESEFDEKYKFLVAVSMPVVGLLIQYSGSLILIEKERLI